MLPGLVLIGATALAVGPLYDVYDVATVATQGTPNPPAVGPVLDKAANGAAHLAAGARSAWCSYCSTAPCGRDHSPWSAPAGRGRRARAGRLAAVVLALVNAGAIADKADEAWTTFKSARTRRPRQGARLTTVYADQRYDYFRVAYEAFEEKPVAGIGFGAYERRYTQERDHEKPSRYAHDVWLRVMGELGSWACSCWPALSWPARAALHGCGAGSTAPAPR